MPFSRFDFNFSWRFSHSLDESTLFSTLFLLAHCTERDFYMLVNCFSFYLFFFFSSSSVVGLIDFCFRQTHANTRRTMTTTARYFVFIFYSTAITLCSLQYQKHIHTQRLVERQRAHTNTIASQHACCGVSLLSSSLSSSFRSNKHYSNRENQCLLA